MRHFIDSLFITGVLFVGTACWMFTVPGWQQWSNELLIAGVALVCAAGVFRWVYDRRYRSVKIS